MTLDVSPEDRVVLARLARANGDAAEDLAMLGLDHAEVALRAAAIRQAFRRLSDPMPSPPPPLIDGLLGLGEIAVLYARWGCFKTFTGIDLALHVATGTPWCGRPVARRRVAHLGYEAPASILRRAVAWCLHHHVPLRALDDWWALVDRPPRFDDRAGVVAMRDELRAGGFGLVEVDTLARGGSRLDENTSEQARIIDAFDLWRDGGERSVLGLSHSGKNPERGLRGWSGVEDAADVLLRLDRPWVGAGPSGPATLENPKQKDRETVAPTTWDLVAQEVGDGGPASAVIRQTTAPAAAPVDTIETWFWTWFRSRKSATVAEAAAAGHRGKSGARAARSRHDVRALIDRLAESGSIVVRDDGVIEECTQRLLLEGDDL